MAEDEEVKEVFLAYLFLLNTSTPITKKELDKNIETFINTTFNLPMNFDINDALNKLITLKLVTSNNNTLQANSIQEAITILDKGIIWESVLNKH